MGKIDENRRKNARLIATEIGGPARFARKLGLSDSRVSQLIGENFTRNIGDKTAMLIEQAFGKENGWLDLLFENDETSQLQAKTTHEDDKNKTSLSYITSEELDLLTQFRQCTTEAQQLLIRTAIKAPKDAKKLKVILKTAV